MAAIRWKLSIVKKCLEIKKETENDDSIFSDVLLVGQPNVGKSVLFSRMTGVRTITSNYSGTTVSYAAGRMGIEGQCYNVIDTPGTYSLQPLDEAAKVTVNLLDAAQRIINVVDATHLERHLALTIGLLAQNKPMVVALNMSDEARHKGIEINTAKLAQMLGVPVIATVVRTGVGVKRLIRAALALAVTSPGVCQTQLGHPSFHSDLCCRSLCSPAGHDCRSSWYPRNRICRFYIWYPFPGLDSNWSRTAIHDQRLFTVLIVGTTVNFILD